MLLDKLNILIEKTEKTVAWIVTESSKKQMSLVISFFIYFQNNEDVKPNKNEEQINEVDEGQNNPCTI